MCSRLYSMLYCSAGHVHLEVSLDVHAQAYRVNDYDANVQLRCTAELTVLSAQCTVCIGLEY